MQTLTNRRKYLLSLGIALLATACVSTRLEPGSDHAAPMADTYTCPMHPQVVKNAPGQCPICGMNLVKKEGAAPEGAAH